MHALPALKGPVGLDHPESRLRERASEAGLLRASALSSANEDADFEWLATAKRAQIPPFALLCQQQRTNDDIALTACSAFLYSVCLVL